MDPCDPDVSADKQYLDRAIQTDAPSSPQRDVADVSSTSMIINAIVDKLSDMDISSSSIVLFGVSYGYIAIQDEA